MQPGKTLTDLETAIDVEIERLKTEPIADWEMRRREPAPGGRSSAALAVLSTRRSSLSQDALFYDHPNLINTRGERIAKVTAADVQRVARQYLVKTDRTVVLTVPKAATPTGGL